MHDCVTISVTVAEPTGTPRDPWADRIRARPVRPTQKKSAASSVSSAASPSEEDRSSARVTGQVPFDQFAMTAWVVSDSGSCTVRRRRRVGSVEHHPGRCREPVSVAAAFGGDVAARSPCGGECGFIEHGEVENGLPQPMDVGDGRVLAAVAAASFWEVEDVAAVTLGIEVAERGAFRECV